MQSMHFADYLTQASSQYHLVETLKGRLLSLGFQQLTLDSPFQLAPGGAYFVPAYGTSLFAFTIPEHPERLRCLRMASAHTDFPCFKLKPLPDVPGEKGNCLRVTIEPYGGMLKRTWFDRPLGVAGAVYLAGEEGESSPVLRLYRSGRPLFLIPSLAPHMDREIEKKEIDVAKELLPLFSLAPGESADGGFVPFLAEELHVPADRILSFDLNLYLDDPPRRIGRNGEFLSAQGIDNVASVAALAEAIAVDDDRMDDVIALACMFDHEEIGSRSKQGADSNLLSWILDRIFESDLLAGADRKGVLARSVFVSMDGAHALHPNFPEKSDATCTPVLGKGFAIKSSASQRYATDAMVTAMIQRLCDMKGIPVQRQANKSGSPGGQTLGPIVAGYLPIPTADVGVPMLGMHSIRETVAVADCMALSLFAEAFLSGK